MQIETKAFGTVEIDPDQVITLTEPMAGFSGYTRFAVLDPDPEHPFKWFQSVDRADICFLIADPRVFFPDYQIAPRPGVLDDLALEGSGDAAVAVILTVPQDPALATANLLAPLVFNIGGKLGRQVILDGTDHPVRAPLFPPQKARQVG